MNLYIPKIIYELPFGDMSPNNYEFYEVLLVVRKTNSNAVS